MRKAVLLLCAALLLTSAVAYSAVGEMALPITADGDLADWAGIWSLAPGEGGIAVLYAFMTDTHLAVAMQASGTTDIGVYDILLDLDNNPDTGYRAVGNYRSAGGDFLIETWTAGFYADDPTGEDWAWKGQEYPIQKGVSNDGATVEVIVPMDILGNPDSIRIGAWANDKDWNIIGFAPETGGDFIPVPRLEDVDDAPITQPITDVRLTLAENLRALSSAAMPGGQVGELSAAGGDGQNYGFALREDAANGRDNASFLLDGAALRVGSVPLAPGLYKVAVQVSSSIRRENANLVFEVAKQDPATPITEDIFDGFIGQWYTVPHDAAKQPPNLTALKAQTDGNRLWFFAETQDLAGDFEIFLSNDMGSGADMTDSWPGAYPAHKITADGRLWAWANGAWEDTGRKATLRIAEKGIEGFVMGARLHPQARAFGVGIVDADGGRLPRAGQPLLSVTAPNRMFTPAIKADGSDGDWKDIPLLAEGSGVIGDTRAARTQEYLYVLTHISGVTDPADDRAFSLNVLVDVDGDPDNGFNHPGYPAHSGIDVLVQDWHSANLELFIFQKPSAEWFSCVYRAPEGIKKAVRDLGEGVYAVEYQIPIALLAQNVPEMSDDFYLAVDRETDMQPGTSVGTAPKASQRGSALIQVPKYRTTVAHLSHQDGSFLDWDAVGGKATPSAEALRENLYATMSQDRLYVLATGEGMNAAYELDIVDPTGKTWRLKDSKLYTPDGAFLCDVFSRIGDGYVAAQVYLEDIGGSETLFLRFAHGDMEQTAEVSSRFTLAKDEYLVYPREDFTLRNNPFHGWAAWASVDPDEDIAQPFSTVFLDVKWAEFEPEKGKYDFHLLEERYYLRHWRDNGVRVLLRFVMDDVVKTDGQRRMDIPAWLYDELALENHNGKGAGTFYDEPELLGGGGFSPNYESPILIQRHRLAIQALATRFDDTAVTAFVQVGSLGHWAEMHTWPDGTGEFPDPDLVGVYMQAYTDAFHHVKLAARKPYPYASVNNWGLYNDMFGDVGAGDTFRDYFMNGCTDMPHATSEHVAQSRMPDFWKYGYSGGEFAEGNVRKFITDAAIAQTLRMARESHASLIGPCSPTDLTEGDADAHAYDANLDALRRQMGYQLSVESVTLVESASPGAALALRVTWRNRGVAPFYYAWPIEFSLVRVDGTVAFAQKGVGDVRAFLPGNTVTAETLQLPEDLKAGTYLLCAAILDMDSGEPAVYLNMPLAGDVPRYPLYALEVR